MQVKSKSKLVWDIPRRHLTCKPVCKVTNKTPKLQLSKNKKITPHYFSSNTRIYIKPTPQKSNSFYLILLHLNFLQQSHRFFLTIKERLLFPFQRTDEKLSSLCRKWPEQRVILKEKLLLTLKKELFLFLGDAVQTHAFPEIDQLFQFSFFFL